MVPVQLFLEFASIEEFQAQIEGELRKGRAFVSGQYELAPRCSCELILVHPVRGEWLPLAAEAVYLAEGEAPGVGVEILEPSEALNRRLAEFAQEEESEPTRSGQIIAMPSAAEKVRGLNAAGRDRIARRGQLAERIALERAYGSIVWEALLSNTLLSSAEVARIAKNHTVSQPILSQIVSNAGWMVKPEVRRALLSNPRLLESHVEKTLRALSEAELKLVLKQTAYPVRVRNVAKRLLGL